MPGSCFGLVLFAAFVLPGYVRVRAVDLAGLVCDDQRPDVVLGEDAHRLGHRGVARAGDHVSALAGQD